MKIEIRVKTEIDEENPETMNRFAELVQHISGLEDEDVDVGSDDEGSEEESTSFEDVVSELPDDKRRYVFRALIQESGHSRRVIHRKATKIGGSPFNDFDPDNETAERKEVGDILWNLEKRGYAKHEGNRWYPIPERFTTSAVDW